MVVLINFVFFFFFDSDTDIRRGSQRLDGGWSHKQSEGHAADLPPLHPRRSAAVRASVIILHTHTHIYIFFQLLATVTFYFILRLMTDRHTVQHHRLWHEIREALPRVAGIQRKDPRGYRFVGIQRHHIPIQLFQFRDIFSLSFSLSLLLLTAAQWRRSTWRR